MKENIRPKSENTLEKQNIFQKLKKKTIKKEKKFFRNKEKITYCYVI